VTEISVVYKHGFRSKELSLGGGGGVKWVAITGGGTMGYPADTHLANASMESPWLLSSCASGRGNAGCDRPAGFMMACAAAG